MGSSSLPHGTGVGLDVGTRLGADVGASDGTYDGTYVGDTDGSGIGATEGFGTGTSDGRDVGVAVGKLVGSDDGVLVGYDVMSANMAAFKFVARVPFSASSSRFSSITSTTLVNVSFWLRSMKSSEGKSASHTRNS